jgi:hypothetical protein
LKGDSIFRHLSYQEAKTRIESLDENVKDQSEYEETRASEELDLENDDVSLFFQTSGRDIKSLPACLMTSNDNDNDHHCGQRCHNERKGES